MTMIHTMKMKNALNEPRHYLRVDGKEAWSASDKKYVKKSYFLC